MEENEREFLVDAGLERLRQRLEDGSIRANWLEKLRAAPWTIQDGDVLHLSVDIIYTCHYVQEKMGPPLVRIETEFSKN